MVSAKIYAEGGGEGQYLDVLFREGWNAFFAAAGLTGRMPRVVRGQGRERTFDLFVTAVRNPRPGEIPLLLVDSEEPVSPQQAATGCKKPYAKGKVSYELLASLDPQRVKAACPSAKALLTRLKNL